MSKARAQALAGEINKFLGTNTLTTADNSGLEVRYISTGILPVDVALGGGLPRGRYTVFTGAFSTLKTYVGLRAIREVQQANGVAALIDTERAFDPQWARQTGIDLSSLIVWPNPDDPEQHTGEEALDVTENLMRNGIDLAVFDSIAAALPQSEGGKRLHKESATPGTQGRLFSLAFRKMTAANRGTAVMFTNQLREQIGVTFGPTEKSPGGRSAGFYASIIANLRPAGKLTRDIKQFTGEKHQSGKETIGQTYRIVIEKSKLSKPWREIFFDWRLDTNQIDVTKFLFTQGVDLGLVEQRGSMWEFDGSSVRGKENFLTALSGDPDAMWKLENLVRQAHNLPSLRQPGSRAAGRKKVGASKPLSSASKASGRTLAVGRAASASTAATQKKSLR